MTYQLFNGLDCKAGNEIGSADQVTMSGGNVPHSSATDPLQAGGYSYEAVYSGDSNYKGSTGDCEPFSVTKATPSITTTQDPASGSVGDTYKDKATLAGTVRAGLLRVDHLDALSEQRLHGHAARHRHGVRGRCKRHLRDAHRREGRPRRNLLLGRAVQRRLQQPQRDLRLRGEPVVVNGAAIHIAKTADAAKVMVGDDIGFTMTVWNSGNGDAHGVTLNDKLPTNSGLNWQIAGQGAGWGGSCAINQGTLSCGPVTVPAGTTQEASTFTVHITSTTSAAAGGDCPGSGTVDNTGNVTTTNDGSDQSSASTCVQALVDLSVTKSGSPATQDLGAGNITWTMVVTNNGPDADTNVVVSDPMPAGNTFVSATTTKGSCTGGPVLNCTIGPMAAVSR